MNLRVALVLGEPGLHANADRRSHHLRKRSKAIAPPGVRLLFPVMHSDCETALIFKCGGMIHYKSYPQVIISHAQRGRRALLEFVSGHYIFPTGDPPWQTIVPAPLTWH